jgi:hypothetical protein
MRMDHRASASRSLIWYANPVNSPDPDRGEQKVKAFHGLMTLSLPCSCGDCAGGTHDSGGAGAGGPDVTAGGAQATLLGLATLQGPGMVRAVLGGL